MISIKRRENGVFYLILTYRGKRSRVSLGTKDQHLASILSEECLKSLLNPSDTVQPGPGGSNPLERVVGHKTKFMEEFW